MTAVKQFGQFLLGQLSPRYTIIKGSWIGSTLRVCAAFVSARTSLCSFSLTHSRTTQLCCMFQPSLAKQKLNHPKWVAEFLVGAAGFEPTLAESESDVLPLNYAPRRLLLYIDNYFFQSNIFVMRNGIFIIVSNI